MATHGGARAGAGRRAKRVKFPKEVGALDARFAAHQEKAARNLIKLSNGGYQRVTRVMKMAGTLTQPAYEKVVGPRGGVTMVRKEVPMFPDLDPQTLVCVEERIEYADPDRAANEYIVNRIAGLPSVTEEEEEAKDKVDVNDEARKSGMEKMKAWRQQSQDQLASIRNPLTGEACLDSDSTNDSSSSHESSTMDDF